MSKQVLDVAQMEHLQELGMKLNNDTLLSWIVDERGKDKPLLCASLDAIDYVDFSHYCIPAYTLQDVMDALPEWTKLSIRVHTTKEWEIGYVYTDELVKYAYKCRILGKELIDAAYEMLCRCIEKGYVKTNKEGKQ